MKARLQWCKPQIKENQAPRNWMKPETDSPPEAPLDFVQRETDFGLLVSRIYERPKVCSFKSSAVVPFTAAKGTNADFGTKAGCYYKKYLKTLMWL